MTDLELPLHPSTSNARSVWRDKTIRVQELVIIIGFIVAVMYHYEVILATHRIYPNGTFLFRPDDQFMDFINIFNFCLNPEHALPLFYTYNPFIYSVLILFTGLPVLLALLLYILSFVIFFSAFAARQLRGRDWTETAVHVVIFSWLTYPFLYSIERGNFEISIFIAVAIFVNLYKSPRHWIALVALAVAISIKPFPGIFLLVLAADRRYRDIASVILFFAALQLLSLIMFDGGFSHNLARYFAGMEISRNIYMLGGSEGLSFTNCYWALVRLAAHYVNPTMTTSGFEILFRYYNITCLLILGVLAWYVIFIDKVYWRRITLLTMAMNLLPPLSGDYKLLHIYTVIFLFLNSVKSPSRKHSVIAISLALLLIPKAYGHFVRGSPETSIEVFVNPFLMTMIAVVVIMDRLSDQLKNTSDQVTPVAIS